MFARFSQSASGSIYFLYKRRDEEVWKVGRKEEQKAKQPIKGFARR